jgi:predicted phosphodiesterase
LTLTREAVLAAVGEHRTYSKAAAALGVTKDALENAIYRRGWKDDVAAVREGRAHSDGATVTIDGTGPLPLADLEKLLAARGLDGSKFIAGQLRVGEWEAQKKGGGVITMHSIRACVIPREEGVTRAALSTRKPVLAKPIKRGKTQLVAVLSDQHVPFHDEALHEHVLAWLADTQPDRIVLLGDLLDMDSLSRHPWDARFHSTLQATIDAGHAYVASLRAVCPEAQIDYLLGNHEDRARQRVIEKVREMYGVRRATDERSALSLEWLLALDELGVVFHTDEDQRYDHSQLRLAPGLVARHGVATRRGAGASALAEMERAMHGVVMGHCHRLGVVCRTMYDEFGEPRVMWAAEAGTLARTVGGLGYAPRPDWQQGALTITVGADGHSHVEPVCEQAGRLCWRGQVW